MQSNVAELPISHKVWAWFESNRKPAIYGVVFLAAVGLIISFVVWHKDQKQLDAGEAFSNVAAGQFDGAIPMSGAVDAYLKVASQYPDSMAGARALLMAAASLFTEMKYPEAQAQFERFAREYPGSPFMGEALLGVGSCLEAQGKTDQAIAAYKDLITRHPSETVIPQAKFALAGLYEAQNKPEQARDLYEEVERAAAYTSFGNEAGIRVEELNAKHPSLAPTVTPILTNAPPVATDKK
jgi:tetratricopeptide (TPR) repeat protein